MALRRRAGILLLVLVAVHPGPASALNAPLSREAFEAAVAEGQSRKKKDLAASYLLGTRQLRNSTIEVFLATPYAFVWYTAAGASRKAGKFNKEALWSAVREKKTVHLLITTISSTSTLVGGSMEKGYPVVQRVAVRVAAAQEVDTMRRDVARQRQIERMASLLLQFRAKLRRPGDVFAKIGQVSKQVRGAGTGQSNTHAGKSIQHTGLIAGKFGIDAQCLPILNIHPGRVAGGKRFHLAAIRCHFGEPFQTRFTQVGIGNPGDLHRTYWQHFICTIDVPKGDQDLHGFLDGTPMVTLQHGLLFRG